MTAVRLALTELRRLTTGTLPKLAVVALALIPTLYAGLYLFANHDPYGRLEQVPAAVVVQDTGTTTTDATGTGSGAGEERHLGRDVADQLLEDGGFGWVETDQQDAEAGVRSGRFDAALVIGPDFSADLASAGRFAPQQASLVLITNDANNYLARTIADTIVGTVRDSIAEQVGSEAADTFLRGFGSIHTNLATAVDGADRLLDGASQLQDGLVTADDGASALADGAAQAADGAATLDAKVGPLGDAAQQLDDGASALAAGLGELQDRTADLPAQTRRLADGAAQVADGDAQVAALGHQAGDAAGEVLPALDQVRADLSARLDALVAQGVLTAQQADDLRAQVDPTLDAQRARVEAAVGEVGTAVGRLDQLADGSRQVADGAAALAAATPQLTAGIGTAADGAGRLADGTSALAAATPALVDGVGRLADGTGQVSDGAASLADGTSRLRAGSGELVDGVTQLRDGLQDGLGRVPVLDDATREDTARTIANPVEVRNDALTSAGTYGGGLAPFFLSLATWIGAYVLFLLVKPLSSRALATGRSPLLTALGGWGAPLVVGVLQVAAMFTVTKFALDIQPAFPVQTALFMVLVSGTFVAIVQMLNVWLGAAGQFLGLVLMLVQLVTAGGTFPWQTIPEPLRALHRFLPMSYSVEGLRQLLYGGSGATAWRDVAVLVAVLAGSLAVTTVLARRRRVWSPNRLQPELVL